MAETGNFKLIIEDDEGRRSVVPVDLGEVSIGRLDGNTIRLNERNVSRRHARFFRDNGSIFAEDLDSYNGVWINGDRIKGRHEIREGDIIRVGDFQLEVRGEGLARRTEETTQRTLMAEIEATQPEIRMGGQAAPPPASALGQAPSEPEPEEVRHEPTAIIRVAHLEDVEQARRGGKAIVAGQRPKLVCVSTQYAGQEFEINKTEAVIGRTKENDIAIDHRSVSRHHAKIVVSGRSSKIVDLKSANGTLVNGEEYAQTELKRGDLIELGHVKFRFVPPGDNYTLTPEELAAIPGRAATAKPSEAINTSPGLVGERRPSIAGLLKANPWVIMAIAGLVVLIAVMIAVMATGNDDDRHTITTPEITIADPAAHANGGDDLLGRASTAFAQRQWQESARLARQVQSPEAQREQAVHLAERADAEAAAQVAYEGAVAAINNSQWSEAWNHLQEIPESSVYHGQAKSLTEQVRAALITERVTQADKLLGEESWDEAEALAEEIASLDGGRPEVARIRSAVEEGRRKTGAKAKPTKQARLKLKEKAKTTTPVAPPPQTPPPKPPVEDVKQLFGDGAAALKAGQFQKAIELFDRCTKADKHFCKCDRALGISYARAGNGPKAYRYYKEYLKCEPNAEDREQVEKLLRSYEQAQ